MTFEGTSTLRSLTPEELDFVSGAGDDEIVVTGTKSSPWITIIDPNSIARPYYGVMNGVMNGATYASSDGGGGYLESATAPAEENKNDGDPNGDDDGDGILNQYEEIIITASERMVLGNDIFAYRLSDNLYFIFKESDWPWNYAGDGPVGTGYFSPATEKEATAIANSENTVTLKGAVGGSYKLVNGSTEIISVQKDGFTTYWKSVPPPQ